MQLHFFPVFRKLAITSGLELPRGATTIGSTVSRIWLQRTRGHVNYYRWRDRPAL
jgi:hypothetical protein